ncbi:MAG: YIP1 family protein [Hydrogenophaga sp.]|uniref:Yip1 family protein n=1 Tax=Hydrogenophaga sp. TaxID=1904254 RepID=UPI0025C00461|nr:Yip1 family protein [Hydrogenophaga sp.]MBT9553874.1 YIP1 family protein [Hydrogenophaga sp.]
MNLVDRVQAILLKPKDTWPVIAGEGGDVPSIYKNYLVYLAAIPAIATFIGFSLVGAGAFGVSFRVPIVSGLVNMVVGFVLSLAMIYVLSLIANALAPTFKGEKNQLNAFKLVAYGSTAGLVGGVFNLLPSLSMLGVLAALYSIYLLYTGIPVLMKAPEDKALGYTAVLIVCGIVASMIVGAVSALFTSGPHMMMGGGMSSSDNVSIKVPGSEITLDTAKIEAMGKQVEAASKKMEEAQAKGDSAAAGKAMSEMMGAALGGGQGGKPFAPDTLQGFVPAKLGAMERTAIEARSDNAMGMTFSSVTSEFRNDAGRVEVKVQDIGAMPALAMAMGAWAQSTVNRETQDEVEKVYQRDGASIKEEYRKDGSRAEMSMMLGNGVMVEVTGDNVNMDGVRAAMAALDVKGLAGLKRQP